MSLLNAFVYPDHAFVCVDTDAVAADGTHLETSKLFVLPHVNAVVGCRGSVLLNSILMAAVVLAPGDFDEISRLLPDMLNSSFARMHVLMPKGLMTPERMGCAEVIIVGFSPALGRIVLHHFSRDAITDVFVKHNNVVSYAAAPFFPDIGLDIEALRRWPNGEGLEVLALSQVSLMRERHPGASAGGRLILAEIRRDSITIETACAFPGRAHAG